MAKMPNIYDEPHRNNGKQQGGGFKLIIAGLISTQKSLIHTKTENPKTGCIDWVVYLPLATPS